MKNKPRQASVLRYSQEFPAPLILLQAKGDRAERVLKLAESLGIPVREDEVLSDQLIRVEAGSFIPEDMYRIVALLYSHFYRQKV